jgi:hypothetical protein
VERIEAPRIAASTPESASWAAPEPTAPSIMINITTEGESLNPFCAPCEVIMKPLTLLSSVNHYQKMVMA